MRNGGHVTELESGIARPDAIAMKYNAPRGEAAAKTESMQRLRIVPDIEEAKALAEAKKAKRLAKPKVVSEAELKLVERIKSMRDLGGVTRKQAAKHMQISDTLMSRLILDHNIDYPKAVNRFK